MHDMIYLWGDSIGKGVIYNPERKRYCLAQHRCSKELSAAGLNLDNHAQMGATVLDGFEDFCQTETQPGSVAVIEFGGNDCDLDWEQVAAEPERFHDGKLSLAAFREMLVTFIRTARARQTAPDAGNAAAAPRAAVFCVGDAQG